MTPPEPLPSTPLRQDIARAFQVLAPLVFAVSLLGALRGQAPFAVWFFSLAWWSVILFVDGWVHRHRGESLLLTYPSRFLFLSLFSVGLWCVFEALNLRLGNWSYHGLPAADGLRWAGYAVSFATVVPALLEMVDLLETAGLVKDGHVKPLGWKRAVEKPLVVAGVLMLLLPMAWPKIFFPLVWGAFALLLDPLNERLGAPSLTADWREGSVKRLKLLLAAGFFCGILWEAFNVVAAARWEYHLPGLDGFRLFAMPLPGYLGFPVFAAGVFVMTSTALALWERAGAMGRIALALLWGGFSFAVCRGVDMFTVGSLS